MVWAVRIAGGTALQREAMGFGDVTLLSMIGAFVGWQASLVVFFLAPFAGMVIGVTQRLMHGQRELPYGPYLCAAALAVLLYWTPIWDFTLMYFSMGWLLVAILAGCMVLMFLMLLTYRLLLEAVDRRRR